MEVTVISGTFPSSKGFWGEGNPSVEIAYGPQRFKTSTQKLADGQVTWNESFRYLLVDPSVDFEFIASATTLFTKKLIGTTQRVGLRELLDIGSDQSKQLTLKAAQGGHVGIINVQCKFGSDDLVKDLLNSSTKKKQLKTATKEGGNKE